MQYKNVVCGTFLNRLNRFTAEVVLNGKKLLVHVKNTGRLKELLVPGTVCGLCKAENPARKTAYDLISVLHNNAWVNIDSNAPNHVASEFIQKGGLGEIVQIKAEQFYYTADRSDRSRFDFYTEFQDGNRAYIEVKGVTFVQDGIAKFPDAPTARGARHVNTLINCICQGYDAYVLFIIQRKDAAVFSPHDAQDSNFAAALRTAAQEGVKVLAIDCDVSMDALNARNIIPVKL